MKMMLNIKTIANSISKNDFWYNPLIDCWFPKCNICSNEQRSDKCPPDCLGDE